MSTLPDAVRPRSPQVRMRPRPRARLHRLSDETPADRQRFPDYATPVRRPNRSVAGSGSLNDRTSMDGRQVFPDDVPTPAPARRPPRTLPSEYAHPAPQHDPYHNHPSGPPSAPTHDRHSHHQQPAKHVLIAPLKQWMTPVVVAGGYVVVEVISEGSFGIVLKAKRLSDDIWVAIKVVSKSKLSEKETANIRKQAITLRTLKHRYIVHFYDDFEDNDFFYHVFEYLHGGDLYDRLEARGKPFSEAQVLFLARQLFYAVSYLHSKRAAHRDVKLENFVFETAPSDQRQVMKLIDFDLLVVRSRQSPRTETCSDICGTILYVSPEIASGREHVPEESDMWACGIMLYVLLSYQMPFQGSTGRQILRAVRSTEPHFTLGAWSNVSPATKQLVKDLLNKNASARPTAEQALERVKMIQASSREPNSGSRLRALKRGLRSVSLNLWDNSGSLVRRGQSDSRTEDKFQNARRAHSNFPSFEEESSPSSSVRSSLVRNSPGVSEGASDLEYASGSSGVRHSGRSSHDRLGGGMVAVPGKQQPIESDEFLTSPALGAVLARRRAVMNHQSKVEETAVNHDTEAAIRSSRRFRKPSFKTRLKNWINMSSQS